MKYSIPSLLLSGLIALAACATDGAADSAPSAIPQPCAPGQWQKGGVILEGEGEGFQNFNSSAEPLADGRWRIWYGHWLPTPNFGVAEGIPGGAMTKCEAVLSAGEPADAPLAVGNLPAGWRPIQPVHMKLKDGRDRLYFWVHAPDQKVVRFLVADSSDGRRYRVINPHQAVLYHMSDRAVEFVGTTPTGLKLAAKPEAVTKRFPRPDNEPPAAPELIANDSVTVYQLEDGSFEMYLSGLVSLEPGDPTLPTQKNDNLKGYRRVVDRMVSQDGLQWSDRRRVIEPDAQDPTDLQFYYLNVTYTPQGRVGMLGHYRLYAQTTDIEWCYSQDGIHWTRSQRKPWIPRGAPYESDSYAIYPATSLVYHDSSWWLFYTGTNYSHNNTCSYGKPQSLLMFAQAKSIWAQ